jgi:hypothetical protein
VLGKAAGVGNDDESIEWLGNRWRIRKLKIGDARCCEWAE